jgi:hypothetical protein
MSTSDGVIISEQSAAVLKLVFTRKGVRKMATELLQKVLEAHGGLNRWSSFSTVHATIVTGGQLFGMKGTPQDPTPRRMTVSTNREWASLKPFGAEDQRTDFTANRIAIEKMDGTVLKERLHPSEHAEGKAADAPWDLLDRAYFNGYALWTYLTTPFHFAMPGFAVQEIDPWPERIRPKTACIR